MATQIQVKAERRRTGILGQPEGVHVVLHRRRVLCTQTVHSAAHLSERGTEKLGAEARQKVELTNRFEHAEIVQDAVGALNA